MTQDIKPIGSPFRISDTPSRVNTLRTLYGSRGQMSTTIKPEPTSKPKHWTEVPKRVEEMHDVARGLIKEYELSKPQGAEWTPEDFITDMKIDTSAEYATVRGRIHHAIRQAWINDLTAILVENGVTDPTEQALAFKPYDTLEEAVNSTGVNIKALRMQVCGFATSHFLKEADASLHKEQPKMDTTNLADVFDPAKTDEQVKAALKAAELDLTGSPDEPTSPNVANVSPAEKKPADPIGELKKHLFNLLATQFTNETDEEIGARMKVALKADSFKEFIIRYNPIEKAREYGQAMIDEYLERNPPQRATEPPPSAIVTIPEPPPQPPQSNVTVERSLAVTGDTQWDVMKQQAAIMLNSGFMPSAIKSESQILTIGMMGQALGIQPIVAINNINVIQGKPTVAPQLMLALIRRTGQLEDLKIEDDGTTCTVTMKRKGESAHVETFSMADAKAMQLDNKDNWRKQPKTMRKWRAISAAARIVFGDVIWGMYTPEEMNPDASFDDAA